MWPCHYKWCYCYWVWPPNHMCLTGSDPHIIGAGDLPTSWPVRTGSGHTMDTCSGRHPGSYSRYVNRTNFTICIDQRYPCLYAFIGWSTNNIDYFHVIKNILVVFMFEYLCHLMSSRDKCDCILFSLASFKCWLEMSYRDIICIWAQQSIL